MRFSGLGNALFAKQDYKGALSKYVKTLPYLSGLGGLPMEAAFLSHKKPEAKDATTAAAEKEVALTSLQCSLGVMKALGISFLIFYCCLQGPVMLSQIYGNIAACYLALQNYEKTVYFSNKVLATDPTNMKALFRRGKVGLGSIASFSRAFAFAGGQVFLSFPHSRIKNPN